MRLALAGMAVQMLTAQVIESVPANFKLDGLIGEWQFQRLNRLRTAQSPQGIVVAGGSYDERSLSTAHIEIWLSVVDNLELPPIGYWGDSPYDCGTLSAAQEKSECEAWTRSQTTYREKLRVLFLRHWTIAQDRTAEIDATASFDSLEAGQQKALAPLKPTGQPISKFAIERTGKSFTFEVLIPWDAFPPVDRLHLERIRFDFLFFDSESATSATYPQPSTPRIFGMPPIARINSCRDPLSGDGGRRAFALLGPSLEVRTAFTFVNASPCCGMVPLKPWFLSPFIELLRTFEQKLAPGEFLCGPSLSYRSEGRSISRRFPFRLGLDSGFYTDASIAGNRRVLQLADGTRLIQDGPSWSLRRQSYMNCAGCPWATFAIFALKPSGEIVEAIRLGGRTQEPDLYNFNVTMSADWRTVTEFRQNIRGPWTAQNYCLRGVTYQKCGAPRVTVPPTNGLLKKYVQ